MKLITQQITYPVAITPGEVLDTDVLVGVLDTLLQRGHVLPVLPVLHPEVVGIEAGESQDGDHGTNDGKYTCRIHSMISRQDILDGELAPEI